MQTVPFEVIEEKRFEAKFDSLRNRYPRMADVHQSITWTLSKDPNRGELVEEKSPGEQYRVYQTFPFGETPGFWVLYKVNWDKCWVTLLSIHPTSEIQIE